jgi:hypothetical protein
MKEAESDETPWALKLSIWARQLLWQTCTNKLIFYSLYDQQSILMNTSNLAKLPLSTLVYAAVVSQTENIVFAIMFLNFAMNANLLSLVLPLTVCYYAILENPRPSYKYWKLVTSYMLVVIFLKFLVQLPIFCSSPVFNLYGCIEQEFEPEILVRRIDYIVGLHKFNGPASYPRDIGIFRGILWDLLLLIMLVNLKSYLVMTGQWHFVRTDSNIAKTPKYKSRLDQRTEAEQAELRAKSDFNAHQLPQMGILPKAYHYLTLCVSNVTSFFFKLQPRYLPRVQANLDMRTQHEVQVTQFNVNKVKPGTDYFNGNFFSLLVLFVYSLFFWRHLTGVYRNAELTKIDLDHFTSGQVLVLFTIMMLMLIERMLYRTRTNKKWSNEPAANQPDIESGGRWDDLYDLATHTLTVKIVLYAFLVIIFHVQIGFTMPISQGVKLDKNTSLTIYYFLWVTHFVFAGLQIKHGYPQAPYKQTFLRDTSPVMVNLFRIYRALPFIWEMKVIIDWTVTNTCLDLFQWFRLDDAFNYVYYNKYQSDSRAERGQYEQRSWVEKFTVGFCFAFGLILLILAPVLLFSGINPIQVENPVKSGALTIKFELNDSGTVYEIFKSQALNIHPLSENEQASFDQYFTPVESDLNHKNLQRVQFTPYSENNWFISSPSLQRMAQDYEMFSQPSNGDSEAKVKFTSSWSFTRDQPADAQTATGSIVREMTLTSFKPFIDLILNHDDAGNNGNS